MIVTTPPKAYEPVGQCIYCGTVEGDLRREHILPFGLGGNLVLPKASCQTCAKATGQIEQLCLRSLLGPTRIRLNLPTRRPKERPKVLSMIVVGADGAVETRSVPAPDYPMMLALYVFPPPGIITGAPDSQIVDGALWVLSDQGTIDRQLGQQNAKAIRSPLIAAEHLLRMLAKIGHAYAVAQVGVNGFRPFLRELILQGTPDRSTFFIGGDLEVPAAEDALHGLWFSYRWTARTRYLVVSVRLFAMLGSPLYHVVVGEG